MYTIHAICKTSDSLDFDIDGVGDEQEVFSIGENGLSAIVSTGGETVYHNMDREDALRLLLIHQRVVEAVLPCGPVIPVKFGTTLPEQGDVLKLLRQAKIIVEETLNEYRGKVQMEVSVSWDTASVFVALSQLPSVMEMKKKAEAGSHHARAALGQHVKELMDNKRYAYAAEILPELKKTSEHTIVQPVMADEVVLNVAMLIESSQEPVLDSVLDEIDQRFDGQFTVRCMGPMPLYSFATLSVRKPDVEAIEAACKLLGIPDSTTISGIKRAYRKQAQLVHPDRMGDLIELEMSEDMAALAQAYRLLTIYAKSHLMQDASLDGERCHFDRQAVEDTLLIHLEKHLSQPAESLSE